MQYIQSSRALRWTNGIVHWISGAILVYAFISNGERTQALIDPKAMRGEVDLGLLVGGIFALRYIWSSALADGRWAGVSLPRSLIRSLTNLGIYAGVGAVVISGLLIAYLRPGATILHHRRGFGTSSLALNAAIGAHAFLSDALIWLCAFHAAYSLWHWSIKRTAWGAAISKQVQKYGLKSAQIFQSAITSNLVPLALTDQTRRPK